MQLSRVGQANWLDREADRLEAAMASMAVPVRVSDGQIAEGRVRYHATPIGGVYAEAIQELGTNVATALGVDRVAIQTDRAGVTIEISPAPAEPLRMLPLLSALGSPSAMTAVAGVDEHGVPVLLNLLHQDTWHFVVESGQNAVRSSWLRSMTASLAVGTRPSELQVLGVDLTGVEQTYIEALPHTLTDVAFRADNAIDLIAWLRDESDRRMTLGRQVPHLVLVVDDLGELVEQTGRVAKSLVKRLMEQGRQSGIHILAGWDPAQASELAEVEGPSGCAQAIGLTTDSAVTSPGDFEISVDSLRCVVRSAHLSAADLDGLARDLQRTSGSGPGRQGD